MAVLSALGSLGLVAALLGGAAGPAAPLPEERLEYAVKAALVYKVARFVDWPKGSTCPAGGISVVLLGEDRFGDAIDRAVVGRRLGERPVRVLRVSRTEDVPFCAVLWLGSDQSPQLEVIAEQVRTRFVVMMGDAEGFASRGGMVGLPVENERVMIEVNPEAAQAGGVTISSRLVGVARLVKSARAPKVMP